MCGIAGMVHPERAVSPRRLHAMCRVLTHRGPDDEGVYRSGPAGLVARRLAIVDLANGRQPLANEDGTVHAVVNGEIYNHRELRAMLVARGHRFDSGSDAAVVPHLYEEYGEGFPARLEGMFALAVWDERQEKLVLARDRLGIKPLYYASHDDGLVFGSEIKALHAAGVPRTVDMQALSDYLSLMYIPGPRTAYERIHALPPATTLVWRHGRYHACRFWDLSAVQPRRDLSPASAAAMLRQTLLASVAAQYDADVPVGFFLSGGLDSASVLATARRLWPERELTTFSVGFEDASYDERRLARLVAERLGTRHVEAVVTPRPEDVLETILPAFDQPFADPSMVPTYYLCRLAREYVGVVLGGDGGDELFAGYQTYLADKLARPYRNLPGVVTRRMVPALVGRLPASGARTPLEFRARRFADNALAHPARSHYLWRVVFREAHKDRLLTPEARAGLDDSYHTHATYDYRPTAFDPLTHFQYTDANVYLPDDVLVKVDRLSMANSLEVRVPLLATDLVEFAFSLPDRLKMPGYRPKRLVRRALSGMLPEATLTAPKRGFNAPLPRWLCGPFRPLVDEYLGRQTVQRQGFFRYDEVNRLVTEHMAGAAEHARQIWILLMFSIWADRHRIQR
ncbi:asparagine synthase (glutamine-hydrolyzing) [Actinocatenispora rupis]|uniref:asparagine synthase (glutamine-hydrolyzing) n=1 Tax=Actinocatenispora rupis TaxID=519421 RepID=A0A8J3IZX4_9ACTN|nr:asparagine synthase (glutamine-hydrolyzing) [Actinocatenispora rupis]GID09475.1 asparagine synthetase B [Actinocatenispora rupis]